MKKMLICMFVLLSAMGIVACENQKPGIQDNTEGTYSHNDKKKFNPTVLEGYSVEDDKSLEELLTKEYSLSELREFFNGHNKNENYKEDYEKQPLTYTEINKRFPVEVIRSHQYSVYKVSEGGYYYVIWGRMYDSYVGEYDGELCLYYSGYISPKDESVFNLIKPRVSSIADVKAIDEDLYFDCRMVGSANIFSYSYLNEEYVMEIAYFLDVDDEDIRKVGQGVDVSLYVNDDTYKVERINIRLREETSSGFSFIFEKDLP